MVHAALLLLMLEAANARPRFTISLKRSTQNLQLSTSSLADYPIFAPDFRRIAVSQQTTFRTISGLMLCDKWGRHSITSPRGAFRPG
jgi:hypothetical protein